MVAAVLFWGVEIAGAVVSWTAREEDLELDQVDVKPFGDDGYQIRLVVHNAGRLSTHVAKKRLERKLVRGIVCEIEMPEGTTLDVGKARDKPGRQGTHYEPWLRSTNH